jgi:hypothetical protein
MTDRQAGAHDGLGRSVLSQYVVYRDPVAMVNDTGLRRARRAHAAIAARLADVARENPELGRQLQILSADPGAAHAFRTGVRLLAEWLDRNPSAVRAFSSVAGEAEWRSHLTYHLGELVGTGPERAAVPVDRLGRLPAPGLNPVKERAELAVIVPVGVPGGQPTRLRNCVAVLHALNRQRLDRWHYRVIVIEQGPCPRADAAVAGLADDYVFAPNPGEFNKSWALNIAVDAAGGATHLCLLDADALPDEDLLAEGLRRMRAGESALLPFSEVLHLDEASSARALRQRLPLAASSGAGSVDERWLRGFALRGVNGFCVWVSRERYRAVGGHDERYRGWGDEDNEFHRQLASSGGVRRLPARMLHLWHPRPRTSLDGVNRPNSHLRHQPRPADGGPLGDLDRYLPEFERSQTA